MIAKDITHPTLPTLMSTSNERSRKCLYEILHRLWGMINPLKERAHGESLVWFLVLHNIISQFKAQVVSALMAENVFRTTCSDINFMFIQFWLVVCFCMTINILYCYYYWNRMKRLMTGWLPQFSVVVYFLCYHLLLPQEVKNGIKLGSNGKSRL